MIAATFICEHQTRMNQIKLLIVFFGKSPSGSGTVALFIYERGGAILVSLRDPAM